MTDRLVQISYAQNYEDVMLWRALQNVKHGFYVDIGANDPAIDSVTKWFYDQGWSGINVEPLKSHYDDLVFARPRDINLRCAAGNSEGEIELWECDIRGWATASLETVEQHIRDGRTGTFHNVPLRSLSSILDEHQRKDIHFLKIDVEGLETEVLQGIDLEKHRPWVILLEATKPNSTIDTHLEWEHLLTDSRYKFVYADGLNRFYLANEHQALENKFNYPPNVFDHFVTAEKEGFAQRAVASEAKLTQREHEIELAKARIIALDIETKGLSTSLTSATSVAAGLRKELGVSRMETASLQSEVLSLKSEFSQLKSELLALRERLRSVSHNLALEVSGRRHAEQTLRATVAANATLQQAYLAEVQKFHNLHFDFDRTLKSLSWRFTKPLRWLPFQARLLVQNGPMARLKSLIHRLRKQSAAETAQTDIEISTFPGQDQKSATEKVTLSNAPSAELIDHQDATIQDKNLNARELLVLRALSSSIIQNKEEK
jgi:FkbM family methyltransferase